MSNQNNQNNQPGKKSHEDFEYIYFKDTQGRLKRLRKKQYKPRQGYIRLKFIQKTYFWWKKKSFDYKNAIVPWILGLSYAYILYQTSMLWSQNQLERQIKARLPFDFEYAQINQMKRLYNQQKGDKQTANKTI